MDPRRMITRAEIFRRAGVSQTTVSQILRHHAAGRKAPNARETIQKVLESDVAFGYDFEGLRDKRCERNPKDEPSLPLAARKR